MSAGRPRRSLDEARAHHDRDRPAPARLDALPPGGAFLAPHRSLRAAARRTERSTR